MKFIFNDNGVMFGLLPIEIVFKICFSLMPSYFNPSTLILTSPEIFKKATMAWFVS
jgi:hypothetical protein